MNRQSLRERYDDVRWAVEFAREADVPFMAAAIAYYAFVSIIPALLLVVSIGTLLGAEAITEEVLALSEDFLTPAGQNAIEQAIEGSGGRGGATVLGVVLLGWSTIKVFRGLDKAFSKVYGTMANTGFLEQTRDALVVVGSIGVGLGGMVALGGILATVAPVGGDVLGLAGLLVGLTIVFLPLFYVFPDAEFGVREALPGTVFAAFGWMLLQAGFQAYAGLAGQFQLYGVLGAILLLVTYFYLAAGIILVGAVVNAILGGFANRQLQHAGESES